MKTNNDYRYSLLQMSLILGIVSAITVNFGWSQKAEGAVYKSLRTKKFYSVNFYWSDDGGKGVIYEVNGREVDKKTYNKYQSTWKNMETCCPCILKAYDENDVLLSEYVACTDCYVGFYKGFYPNGQLQLMGHFKENPTQNWKDISDRDYCSVRDGEFAYYDTTGTITHREFWENGNFVKQVPELAQMAIWRVDLTLRGEPADKKTLQPADLGQLVVTPRFKNASREGLDLTVRFKVSNPKWRYKTAERLLTPGTINTIDLETLLRAAETTLAQNPQIELIVYNAGVEIADFYLDVKE